MYQNIFKYKKRWAFAIVTMVIALIFISCTDNKKEEREVQKEVRSLSYRTGKIQLINPKYDISIPAELMPYEQVAVYAKVTGFVKRLYVDRGDRVRKGQLLATLEAPEMNQQYLSNKSTEQKVYSDYLYAKQLYERLKIAAKTSGAVAEIELDRAKSALKSAKSAYEASSAGVAYSSQLQQYLNITAPFDGVITDKNVSVGALTGKAANLPLFMIAQSNKLRLTLSLPEKHASSVKNGMLATFTVSSQPGRLFEAKLSRTSELLDQNDRSLKLEFDVNNSSGNLHGGDYAQVNLKLQRKKPSFWVQSKSVLTTQSGTFVLTFNGSEVKRIAIKEGLRLDALTEVFGNLSINDQIIKKPSEEIKIGQL